MKNDEKILSDNIILTINETIKKIAKDNTYCKLENIFNSIESFDDKNKIYENIINYYLRALNDFEIADIKSFLTEVEYISCFFDYAYFAYDNEIKRRCYVIQECAEGVANDLVAKCCKYNDRRIKLPLSLDILEIYSINYEVTALEIEKVILWIILRLAVAYYLLTNK